MQTRTKKTLATGALGVAFAATAAVTGAASASAAPTDVLGALPVGSAANLVPGAASAQSALADGTSALPGNPTSLLPTGNHLEGNQIAPVGTLLGGLPIGG